MISNTLIWGFRLSFIEMTHFLSIRVEELIEIHIVDINTCRSELRHLSRLLENAEDSVSFRIHNVLMEMLTC